MEGCIYRGKIILEAENGTKLILEDARIMEVEVEGVETGESFKVFHRQMFNVSIVLKRITRKKFIKLLMTKGYGRNAAHEITKKVHEKYGSYNSDILRIY